MTALITSGEQSHPNLFTTLNKALVQGEEVHAIDLLSNIHRSYYKAYKQSKCYDDALKHLELFIDLEKKLHKDALAQRVQNLEISFMHISILSANLFVFTSTFGSNVPFSCFFFSFTA